MPNNRWIRTFNGYAGRNGYIIKTKTGFDGYFYADGNCSPVDALHFGQAHEAKKFMDDRKSFGDLTDAIHGAEVTD